jgi:sugar-specific transcriptional regulator TrmB
MIITKYIEKSLIALGLTEGEAKLYIKVLESNGYADASFLKKNSNYSYAGIYKLVNSLEEQGFIISSQKRPTTYAAIPLNKLSNKFARTGRKFSRTAEKLKELDSLSLISKETDVYEGNDLTDFYLNIPFKIEDFIWCIGSFEAVVSFFGWEMEKEFIKNRIKKGKFADAVIFDNSKYSYDIARCDKLEKRETRIVPHNNYPLQFSYLFNNTILDFYKNAENKVKVLKTENPDIAKARLIQYQQLWAAANN